jgi:DNA polymerase III epsilon subunit-like protein|tara:strand:+ start:273 stop:1184 length:912 start_codon:yes stop_codon:yes gene_type:complete
MAIINYIKMQRLEHLNGRTHLFIFDLEFIGDVRNLKSCQIWEIAVCSVQSGEWFEKVVDPDPTAKIFPNPPIPEIPQLTRDFLDKNKAIIWSSVFQELATWVENKLQPGTIPVFVSHNTFRADKPVLELECRRYNIRIPLHWYFFDSLHYSRSVLRNSTGNYSLSGLHEQLFKQPIENVHRARADVVACMRILTHLTDTTWCMLGPVYPAYSTSLRTIRWIGRKAEEILCGTGMTSVENLVMHLENNIKSDYLRFNIDETLSVEKTINNLFHNKLPSDNINNIIAVLESMRATTPFSYTFMSQ